MKRSIRSPFHRGKVESRIANRPNPYADLLSRMKSQRRTPYEQRMVDCLEEMWPSGGLAQLKIDNVEEPALREFFFELEVIVRQSRNVGSRKEVASKISYKGKLSQDLAEIISLRANPQFRELISALGNDAVQAAGDLIGAAYRLKIALEPRELTKGQKLLIEAADDEAFVKTFAAYPDNYRAVLVAMANSAKRFFGSPSPSFIKDLLNTRTLKADLKFRPKTKLTKGSVNKVIQRAQNSQVLQELRGANHMDKEKV